MKSNEQFRRNALRKEDRRNERPMNWILAATALAVAAAAVVNVREAHGTIPPEERLESRYHEVSPPMIQREGVMERLDSPEDREIILEQKKGDNEQPPRRFTAVFNSDGTLFSLVEMGTSKVFVRLEGSEPNVLTNVNDVMAGKKKPETILFSPEFFRIVE